jgi:hypothetical protein
MSSTAVRVSDVEAEVASGGADAGGADGDGADGDGADGDEAGIDVIAPLFESARVSVRTACSALHPEALSGPDAVSLFSSVVEMLRVATSAKMSLASRIDSSGVSRESGYRNAAAQVADIEGVGMGAATTTLLTAGRLRECRSTGEAMANGDLSEAQAKAITAAAVLAPEREGQLIESARKKSITELGDDCRRVRAASARSDPMATYKAVHEARTLRHWTDEQGALCLQGRFTTDVGANMVASLDALANELFEESRKAGAKEPLCGYRADALAGLVTGERDSGHPAAVVNVRVDHDSLLRGYPVGTELSEIEGVGPIPVPKVIDLMSDAGIKVIFFHGEDISKVFHFTRTINASLLTALQHRDPCCVVPRCGATRFLEIDHLVPFAEGGPTTISNLARLCTFHHGQKTNEGYTLWCDKDKQWHFDPPPPFGQEPDLGANLPKQPHDEASGPLSSAQAPHKPPGSPRPPPLFELE